LSSLSVVTNANRLRRWRPGQLPEVGPVSAIEPLVEVGTEREPAAAATITDPVCGMHIDPATAAARRYTEAGPVYFCSTGCAEAYDADPSRYSSTAAHHRGV